MMSANAFAILLNEIKNATSLDRLAECEQYALNNGAFERFNGRIRRDLDQRMEELIHMEGKVP